MGRKLGEEVDYYEKTWAVPAPRDIQYVASTSTMMTGLTDGNSDPNGISPTVNHVDVVIERTSGSISSDSVQTQERDQDNELKNG